MEEVSITRSQRYLRDTAYCSLKIIRILSMVILNLYTSHAKRKTVKHDHCHIYLCNQGIVRGRKTCYLNPMFLRRTVIPYSTLIRDLMSYFLTFSVIFQGTWVV